MTDHDFIHIANVSKHFGPVRAVDGVDLQIGRGEFFSLLGPSGCGKTTLLRMLGGFETPTSGEIFIDGEPVSGVPPYRRPVNMVFQSYAIFPHLNVFQNIAFGLRKQALTRDELSARVDEALAMIRLEGYGERRADELSGGQRQRVALARALIKRPKVLLLDEPLGALDKKLREQMQLELRDLQKSLGISFILVTHDQEEALTMSDRIAVMDQGKVLEADSPTSLYAMPRTRFVAEFLGAMNIFEGRVGSSDGKALIVDTDRLGRVRLPASSGSHEPGDAVVLGLRPEKIFAGANRKSAHDASAQAIVRSAAYLGDRTHLYVTVQDQTEPILVAMQNADDTNRAKYQSGDGITVSWPQQAVLLLEN